MRACVATKCRLGNDDENSSGVKKGRLAGFELGVDDYMIKPLSLRELAARFVSEPDAV